MTRAVYLDIRSDLIDGSLIHTDGKRCLYLGITCLRGNKGTLRGIESILTTELGLILKAATLQRHPTSSLYLKALRRYTDSYTKSRLKYNQPIHLHRLDEEATHPKGPQNFDDDLRERGHVVGALFAQDPKTGQTEKTLINLTVWARSLLLVGSESITNYEAHGCCDDAHIRCHMPTLHHNPSTRMAAVLSIGNFFKQMLRRSATNTCSPDLISIYLALYDTMNDDDEDVRKEGARIASLILSNIGGEENTRNHGLHFSPPAAKQRLLMFLVTKYPRSSRLWAEGLVRISGLLPCASLVERLPLRGEHDWEAVRWFGRLLNSHVVMQSLCKTTRVQNAVFEVENQNLYVDSVREVDDWVHVVQQLQHGGDCARVRDRRIVEEVEMSMHDWITDGLYSLRILFEDDRDGALGICSRPEVFTLVYRVVAIFKCRQHWYEFLYFEDSNAKENWIVERGVRRLKELRHAGEKANMHPLLLAEIDEVLVCWEKAASQYRDSVSC